MTYLRALVDAVAPLFAIGCFWLLAALLAGCRVIASAAP